MLNGAGTDASFMQMHTGDFSREALEQFAAENENVESFR